MAAFGPRRPVALTAALATAACAVLAAAAIGLPPALLAVLLIPGIALTIVKPPRPLPRLPGDPRVVLGFAAMGALLLYAMARTPQHYRYFLLAVVPLSLLWPHVAALRISLVVTALSLPGAGASLSEVAPLLLGIVAAAAVALVTTNRPRFLHNSPGDDPRYIGSRAAVVFAAAALIAFVVASLLPSPQSGSPSAGESQRGGSPEQPEDKQTYLQPADRLDAGDPGTGDSKEVLFRVSARSSALWRTMTFDTYDGRSWFRSTSPFPIIDRSLAFVPPGPGDGVFDLRRALDQRIEIRASYAGVLPAAARLFSARLPDNTQARTFGDGTAMPLPGLGRGGSYVAQSILVPSAPDDLRPHDASATDIPPDVASLYLDVPELPERVVTLTRDITAAPPTQYDKVAALEAWLATNTSVARDAPGLPAGADPIDQLLFVDRRGSAVQAATAMTLMLRSLQIPARLAVGYLPGDRPLLGDEFVVRAGHAHAWVEVWFPDVGWAAFDPSGFFDAPSSRADSLLERLSRLWWLLLVVVAAVVAWLVTRAVRRARRRRARPWATRCYEQILEAGRRRGRPRRPEETPAEYCTALATAIPDERLAQVGELVTVAAWSEHEPAEAARRWADAVVASLPRGRSRTAPPG